MSASCLDDIASRPDRQSEVSHDDIGSELFQQREGVEDMIGLADHLEPRSLGEAPRQRSRRRVVVAQHDATSTVCPTWLHVFNSEAADAMQTIVAQLRLGAFGCFWNGVPAV